VTRRDARIFFGFCIPDLQEGIRAADEGDVVSHQEMKARLREKGYR